MKKNTFYIVLQCLGGLIFYCFFLQSCHNVDDITTRTKKYFATEKINFDENLKCCLIIPGGGCSGCIASGISFLAFNRKYFSKDQSDNIVIFTSIVSLKVLKRNLNNIKFEDFNVVVDSLDRYTVNFKENIYPLIIYLNKGNIVKVETQSPDSDGLYNLQQLLEKKYDGKK